MPKYPAGLFNRVKNKLKTTDSALRLRARRKAGDLGISSATALFAIASEIGISYQQDLQRLSHDQQAAISEAVSRRLAPAKTASPAVSQTKFNRQQTKRHGTLDTVSIIIDTELKSRCRDLLRATSKFDRVIREATVLLEDRIRQKSGIVEKTNPQALIAKALNPDLTKAILKLGSDSDEQRGLFNLVSGTLELFRNKHHHRIDDSLTREDAAKFCGFIDILLGLINLAHK